MRLSGRDAYHVMLKNYPDVLTITDVSSVLNISTKTVYRLLHDGKITSMKVGRTYRIPKIHLMQYLAMVNDNANQAAQ